MQLEYNFKDIEELVQRRWNFSVDQSSAKPKCYVLEMWPYPSGSIHMGHLRNYTIGDAIARYKRACGFNVLHPMGWDAFGLPAENAALANGISPRGWTEKNIAKMKKQLKSIGLSYNWQRETATCDPEYYRHEQQFFLDFLKNGLAYRKESWVNWDPVDNTVLANEQVIDGRGWRSGAVVEKRKLHQWFLKITDFSEELVDYLQALTNWPEKVKSMQSRWIGKSEGVKIKFKIKGSESHLEVFTTSPHTIFGASFCAISPQHPLLYNTDNQNLKNFISECAKNSTATEILDKAEKKGVDTGLVAIHPFLSRELPIYVANFVLMEYGTGAIFGCPAHDKRDFEFASKYDLPVLPVLTEYSDEVGAAVVICNSGFLDGLDVNAAKEAVISRLGDNCEVVTNYRLHDWGISRQRYWGCPIPVIHCQYCNIVPVPPHDLPVLLPNDISFVHSGNPLSNHPTWKHVKCPICGGDAERETDTFDTFFESSWYFASFCSNDKSINKKDCEYFLPVDYYIGGIEHAVLHLLYSRFFCRALKKCGYIDVVEPFSTLITQGMICHPTYKDQQGNYLFPDQARQLQAKGVEVKIGRAEKMSKSKKNVVDPNYILAKYGADTARLFMLSDTPPDRDIDWSDDGLEGAWRYINRLWRLVNQFDERFELQQSHAEFDLVDGEALQQRKIIHRLLHTLTSDLDNCRLNTAIAKFREIGNLIQNIKNQSVLIEAVLILIRVIEPFIPHIAEAMWERVGGEGMLWQQSWPQADSSLLISDNITIAVQINGKLRATIEVAESVSEDDLRKQAFVAVSDKIGENQIKKAIVVPGKIVNFVI